MKGLKYFIKPYELTTKELKKVIEETEEIKFISLAGIDLGNRATDEKIPKQHILDNFDGFIENGIQTDGSSVYLPIIAQLNNAKVDLIPDTEVKWFVDYNYNNLDEKGRPIGTLDIPSLIRHSNKLVGSRSILKNTMEFFNKELINLINDSELIDDLPIKSTKEIDEVILTTATELEFWVKTPDHRSDLEKLSASQELKEQYWKRTVGQVRTAMEDSLLIMDKYDLEPEMGHKEVGGVKSKLTGTNKYTSIMEQLEIDWKYDCAIQSADNEIYVKNMIKDSFENHGLEVTFKAKPIEGVAGSGEHTHIGIALLLKNGEVINLFSHKDHENNYLSNFGWGALYGLMHNYEIVNPFVTSTIDAFKRLKPGFEAPVSTVASIGYAPQTPSRNRTVLTGLIRDINNPMATRFELRSPNPFTNTYLATSAIYLTILDGIKYVVNHKKTSEELYQNFMKDKGEEKFYLEKDRLYVTEKDVFDDFSEDERNDYFGKPPSTVYENFTNFKNCSDKKELLYYGNIFTNDLINSYVESMMDQWINELRYRVIPENTDLVRRLKKLHDAEDISDLDVVNWKKVNALRHELVKDSLNEKSLFTKILDALEFEDYKRASDLQIELESKVYILKELYSEYKSNIINY